VLALGLAAPAHAGVEVVVTLRAPALAAAFSIMSGRDAGT